MVESSSPRESTRATGASLSGNFRWALVANILYAACQWAMLVVLAKTCTAETVGIFALALAVTTPVIMFAQLQLRWVQGTDASRKYAFHEYVQVRLLTTVCAFVVIALVCVASRYSKPVFSAVLAAGAWKCVEGLSDILYGLFQQHELIRVISISMILKGILSLLVFCGALLGTKDVAWALCAVTAVSAVVLGCYDIPCACRLRSQPTPYEVGWRALTAFPRMFSKRRLLQLASLALPLGFVQMLVSLSANVPRYALQRWFGSREIGIYSAIAYFIIVGNLVVNAFVQSASPRLARHAVGGELSQFRRLLLSMVGGAAALGVAGILASALIGKWLLGLCYGPQYAANYGALVLLMIGGAITYIAWMLGAGMTAAQIFRPQVPLLTACLVSTGLASVWLVPTRGIEGAATAYAVGMIVQSLGSAAILYKWYRRQWSASRNALVQTLDGVPVLGTADRL